MCNVIFVDKISSWRNIPEFQYWQFSEWHTEKNNKIYSELKLQLFSNGIPELYTFWLIVGPHMWRNNIWIVTAEGTSEEDMHN
jgi:hypothetical protein